MYKPSCGIDNVMMSWGHDEYFYHVLKNHGATLPEQAMAMIRYHSFYPWHLNGDYKHLENNADKQKKEWVQKFK